MKVTRVDNSGIDLITSFEGLKLYPYLCPANVPTIGSGTTRYPNGIKLSMKDDIINKDQAIEYFKHDLNQFELAVDAMAVDIVNQNQFNALVSFAYNLGSNALKGSTLLKLVNANPNNPAIRFEFGKWVNAVGKKLAGLVRRRQAEADLYFKL